MQNKVFFIIIGFFLTFSVLPTAKANNLLSENDIKIYKTAIKQASKQNFEEALETANEAQDKILVNYIKWLELLKKQENFDELADFIYFNPVFPRLYKIRRNAESSINEDTDDAKIVKFFHDFPPLSTEGQIHYIEFLQKNNRLEEAVKVIKETWTDVNFNEDLENDFLRKYGNYLNLEDHQKKVDNLLWERHATKSKKYLNKLDKNHRLLAESRIALIKNARKVDKAIEKVPEDLINDPGLVFDRAVWRRRKDRPYSAYEMHINKSANMVHPDKWWYERNILIRSFLKLKDYKKAYQLASDHNLESGADFALAEWISGFISLVFFHNNEQAFDHFEKMYQNVSSPVSLARGAYWCGRAKESSTDPQKAQEWYKIASQYKTTFYGQLADKIVNTSPFYIKRDAHKVNNKIVRSFKNYYVINMIKALSEVDEDYDALLFSIAFFNSLEKEEQVQAFLKVIYEYIERPDIAVAMGRRTRYMKNMEVIDYSYPVFNFDFVENEELPLVLAISRQESNFNSKAKSPAGARGFMQLMPSTAKRVSKELKLKYDIKKLSSEVDYNIRLGSHYINKQLSYFDNNYILAIAAYNAGARNVKRWLKDYGDPRKNEINIIDWLELLPYSETRNYVQRVLENYEIYRELLNQEIILSENFEKFVN